MSKELISNRHNKKEILKKTLVNVLYPEADTAMIEVQTIEQQIQNLNYRQFLYVILFLDKDGLLNKEVFLKTDWDEITMDKIQLCIMGFQIEGGRQNAD